jgi:hypothetical protein
MAESDVEIISFGNVMSLRSLVVIGAVGTERLFALREEDVDMATRGKSGRKEKNGTNERWYEEKEC